MIRTKALLAAALVAGTLLVASPAHATPSALLAPAAPVAQASGQLQLVSTIYTVGRNDTLSGIAARFCGHASAYPALAKASGIANPNRIWPGQRITLHCVTYPKAPAAAAAAPRSAATSSRSAVRTSVAPANSSKAAAVVAYALSQVGKAYVWAASGPNAFDCSGLVMAAYSRVGVTLPHNDRSMRAYGRTVSRAELQPGDAVFPFDGHVMIYIGNGRVVEAANPRVGVRTTTLYGFMTARRYV